MHIPHLSLALVLSAALTSQTYSVSPASSAAAQGTTTNPIPLSTTSARYQQIHGDLRGLPGLIQGISLRRGAGTQANALARTLDLTVLLAESDVTKVSSTFASNYKNPPIGTLPKTQLNFPDWTVSGGSPEPWSVVVPFTIPFVYLGQNDLLWEWVIENNTGAAKNYAVDAYSGITADLVNATSTTLGTGCTATGQTAAMSFGPRCYTSTTLGGLYWKGTALNGVINSNAAVLLGATNPNLPVPGLCTNLYTDALLAFPTSAGAAGSFSSPDLVVPYNPAWQGAKLYSQAMCYDAGQPGLPFALSAGIENVIPAFPAPGAVPIVRIFDTTSATGPVGTVNYYSYGLVVRFTR